MGINFGISFKALNRIKIIKNHLVIYSLSFFMSCFAKAGLEKIIVPTDKFVGGPVSLNLVEYGWPSRGPDIKLSYSAGTHREMPMFSPTAISQFWSSNMPAGAEGPNFMLATIGGYDLSIRFTVTEGSLNCFDSSLRFYFLTSGGTHSFYVSNFKGQSYFRCSNFTSLRPVGISISAIELNRFTLDEVHNGLAKVDTSKGRAICANSTVNSDTLALHEDISLIRAPFHLSYASDRLRPNSTFKPKSLGLGGWTPSLVHRYITDQKGIYFGDGTYRNVEAVSANGGYYATDSSGSEIYYFDANGVHNQTKDGLTGITKYSFTYDSNGRIISLTDRFGKSTSFNYAGNQASITSPYGQITELKFDSNGFLNSVKNPNNETFALVNSVEGYLTSFTKPGGQTSIVNYDSNGYVTKDTGAGGDFISLVRTFDAATSTQKVVLSSALDRKTEFTTISSEAGKSIHKVLSPDGSSSESNSQDKLSESSSTSVGVNSQSTQAQDPRFGWMAPFSQSSSTLISNSNVSVNNQVIKTADLSTANDPLSFSKLTQKTILQNDSSQTYSSEYNKATRTLSSLSPMGRVNYTVLNDLGQIGILQQGTLEPVYFKYDTFGRISAIKQGTRISHLAYDNLGNLSKIQDPLGKITSFKHDLSGRVIEQIRPDQKSVRFTYDANGNMTSLTPADSQTHQFSLNLFELTDTYSPPALAGEVSTRYSYNLDKQPIKVSRPDGKEINFNYNSQSGKLANLTFNEGNLNFSYIPTTGQVASVLTSENVRSDFSYLGPLLQESTLSVAGVQLKMNYAYQADGKLSSLSPGAASPIAIVYDKDSSPTTIGSQNLSYDPRNGLLNGTSLGFISETLTRNKFGETTAVNYQFDKDAKGDQNDDEEEYSPNHSSIFSYQLNRDAAGRIISKSENFRGKKQAVTGYSFDSLGRLTEVKNDKQIIYYQYDANGNRLRRIEGRNIIPARYDAQDRLIKYGDTDFAYNANGDLTAKYDYDRKEQDYSRPPRYDEKNKKKQITQYSYDSLGNLRKVILPNGKVIEYLIDGQNRRVGKKINGQVVQLFMYQSQLQVAAEFNGQGKLIRHFVYGSKSNIPDYFIQNGIKYKIISDHLGSPRLIINSDSGKIMAKLNYDEFGVTTEVSYKNKMTPLPFGFAGGLYDFDTELVRFGARDYMPEVGRWTSKDPIGFAGGQTNLFGYTNNDPINWIDSLGLSQEQIDWAISWLNLRHPEIFPKRDLTIKDSIIPKFILQIDGSTAEGVSLPNGLILINTAGMTNKDVVGMVVHELLHANFSMIENLFGNVHDFIYQKHAEIQFQYGQEEEEFGCFK